MRSRRVLDGNRVIFDARELFSEQEGKILLEMRNGPASYTTEEGVKFWNKHPFQWVSKDESKILLASGSPEFKLASMGDLEDYYSYD